MEGSPHSIDSYQDRQKDVCPSLRSWDKQKISYGQTSADSPSKI